MQAFAVRARPAQPCRWAELRLARYGTASGALLVGQTTDGAADEYVVDGVATLPGSLGRHIPEKFESFITPEGS